MAYVVLPHSDMALFSDVANTRVIFPRLTAGGWTETPEEAVVKFYGDSRATPFRGEGETVSYPFAARYFPAEQQLLADMIALFKLAHLAPDSRLMLRSNAAGIPDLNPVEVVTVATWTPTPTGAGHYDFTFTANAVEFTVGA
ncbi:MAG: hypothetical protein JWN67_5045 [Actinomycetia bacterium]|nr:hypothetical protein [Actinomycetes bacterium]